MKTKIATVLVIWLIACVQTKAQVSYDVIRISTLGDKAGSTVRRAQPQRRNSTDCCQNEKRQTCCQKSGRSCDCRSKGAAKRNGNRSLCSCGLGCQKDKGASRKCCDTGGVASVGHGCCHGSTTDLPSRASASVGKSSPSPSNIASRN